jgi:hypothetical protein
MMTPDEYRKIYAALGLTQVSMGRFLGFDARTSRRWAAGNLQVPQHVEMLLRIMIKYKISPNDAFMAAFRRQFHGEDRRFKDDDE